MKLKTLKLMIVITLAGILVSCGGGSGSADRDSPPVDTSSSDWDGMVWDQDDWG